MVKDEAKCKCEQSDCFQPCKSSIGFVLLKIVCEQILDRRIVLASDQINNIDNGPTHDVLQLEAPHLEFQLLLARHS
jgi:hypothetical protein